KKNIPEWIKVKVSKGAFRPGKTHRVTLDFIPVMRYVHFTERTLFTISVRERKFYVVNVRFDAAHPALKCINKRLVLVVVVMGMSRAVKSTRRYLCAGHRPR